MRAWIYDRIFLHLTSGWYREVLRRLPRGACMLDVGIGTGSALARNAALVNERDLQVVGVDVDGSYLRRCRRRLGEAGLARRVKTRLESIYHHKGGPYQAVYFSGSFMLLPDPVAALRHVTRLLAPGGRIYLTLTINTRKAPILERLKPMLHRLTSIHFGRVTYEHQLLDTIRRADLQLDGWHTLARTGNFAFCLATARRPIGPLSSDLALAGATAGVEDNLGAPQPASVTVGR
jgi:ubiquinone/menaquinone biosynthesis C-methylase UbiE